MTHQKVSEPKNVLPIRPPLTEELRDQIMQDPLVYDVEENGDRIIIWAYADEYILD